jgi:predicted transcriptional regulator
MNKKSITIRIDPEVLSITDKQAKLLDRPRIYIIEMALIKYCKAKLKK